VAGITRTILQPPPPCFLLYAHPPCFDVFD
jgi:hypothetical protein